MPPFGIGQRAECTCEQVYLRAAELLAGLLRRVARGGVSAHTGTEIMAVGSPGALTRRSNGWLIVCGAKCRSWPVTASMANGRCGSLWGKAAARSVRWRGRN